jgi:hypothetical protein
VFDAVDALTVLGAFLLLLILGAALTAYLWSPRCPKCGRRNGINLDVRICTYCGFEQQR